MWEITPNTYTLSGGPDSLGSTYNFPDPANWLDGASTLNVAFNNTGVYTVKQIVGNALECSPDTLFTEVCVDSIPVASMRLSTDTICVGDSITAIFDEEIAGICDTLDIRWRDPQASHGKLGVASPYDTTQNYIFYQAGVYPIRMVAENQCDSVVLYDTVVVRESPLHNFPMIRPFAGWPRLIFQVCTYNLLFLIAWGIWLIPGV
ncbi:MAG: hypothetical protein U5L96_09800 [Owenweeksia sp.]|nr:hypothetical protein [Owenweeksia sp.]